MNIEKIITNLYAEYRVVLNNVIWPCDNRAHAEWICMKLDGSVVKRNGQVIASNNGGFKYA